MTPRTRLLLALVAAVAVVLAISLWRDRDDPSAPAPAPSASPSPAAHAPTMPAAPPATPPSPPARARLDPARREAMIASLAAARARRDAPVPRPDEPAGGTTPTPALPSQVLDKAYVQQQMSELVPLVKECYEQALVEQPGLGGKLIVEFAIGAEPEVGGLVESSKILETSTLVHAGMAECVRETMYAAEFVAPPHGGRVVVRYPFAFSSDPE